MIVKVLSVLITPTGARLPVGSEYPVAPKDEAYFARRALEGECKILPEDSEIPPEEGDAK